MSEPQGTPAATDVGEAPSLLESGESSVKVLFQPGAAYGALRFRPSPSPAQSLALVACWAFLGNLLTALMLVLRQPGASLIPLALGCVGALVVMLPFCLIGAGILHALALMAGAQEGFRRSLQLLALLGALAPLTAASAFVPVPLAALGPTLYGTFLAVRGVELMHHAPAAQAWMTLGLCGGLFAVGQVVFARKVAVLQSRWENVANLVSTNGLAAMRPAPPGPDVETVLGLGAEAAEAAAGALPPAVPEMAGVANLAEQAKSSLDMFAQGQAATEGRPTFDPAEGPPGSPPAGDPMAQMTQLTSAMMGMLNQQMAANPKALESLPPEQRAQIQRVMQAANQMTTQMQQGNAPTPEQRRQLRQMMQGMGQSMPQAPPFDASERPAPRRQAAPRPRRAAPPSQPSPTGWE